MSLLKAGTAYTLILGEWLRTFRENGGTSNVWISVFVHSRYLSRCIYIRVGDARLPTFFVFGVRDKCRGQRMFVIFLVLDLHHCLYRTRTKPKIH